MTKLIPEEVVEEVRHSSDLVKVISGYLELKKSGRNYVGLCPFHQEKTPSFMVSPEKQIFHCFGCGQGGNVFSFIMEREHMSFPEAVKLLARQAGIRVPEREMTQAQQKEATLKEDLKKALGLAVQFYHIILTKKKAGAAALEYLKKRGVSEETIKKFSLGYAPLGWENLIEFAGKKGIPPDLLLKAGLAGHRPSGGFYDSFRDRIIFPISNLRGEVIGLGGRIFGEGEPKYYNSPMTVLYDKSRNLFGLDQARRGIRDRGFSIMMEGYMDVIIAHQHGIDNAVASLGTSLTSEQAGLLRVQAREVVIAYDADAAGDAATLRGLKVLKRSGCSVRVAELPRDMDPDDYIRFEGAEAFNREIVDKALPLMDYQLKKAREKYDIEHDTQDKISYTREALALLADLQDPLERESYVKKMEEELSLPGDALRQEMRKFRKAPSHGKKEKEQAGGIEAPLKDSSVFSESAERSLLALILQRPGRVVRLGEEGLVPQDFGSERYGGILSRILERHDRGEEPTLDRLLDTYEDRKTQALLAGLALEEGLSDDIAQKVLSDCIKRVKLMKLNKERKNIEARMQEMEKGKENQRIDELLKEWERLLKLEDSLLHPRERRE